MRMYKPKYFKIKEEITMEEIETFYSTVFYEEESEIFVHVIAPLLVCMALHKRREDIAYLLKKYPLVEQSGWTPALEKDNDDLEIASCVVTSQKVIGRVKEIGNYTRDKYMPSVQDFLSKDWSEELNSYLSNKES